MAPNQIDFAAFLDNHLQTAQFVFSSAALEIEASSVVVFLMDPPPAVRVVYSWPDVRAGQGSAPEATCELKFALKGLDDPVITKGVLAEFLKRATGAAMQSFLALRWPEQGSCKILIAFGYAARAPVHSSLPTRVCACLHVAAFATWAFQELARLRHELRGANQRLGERKNIERAKGILQVQQGWTEQEAYEHLRGLSRQRRRSLSQTAQDILRKSLGEQS